MASPSPSFLRSNGSRGAHFCPVIEGFHCQVMPAAFIAISLGLMACMLVVHPMRREQPIKRNS
jgi:hypothetical protein